MPIHSRKAMRMVPQFHPAPVVWILQIQYVLPNPIAARGYAGWKPETFPVVGWLFDGDVHAMVSYRGEVQQLEPVLEDLRDRALARAAEQHLSNSGSINYTLAPA